MGYCSQDIEREHKVMELGRFFDIFAAIVSVALAYVVVSSANTANIINAWGSAFSGGLRAAMGN